MGRDKTFGDALIEHADVIVQRWYETWCHTPRRHPDISEALLKDSLPLQLRVIGEQLGSLDDAEPPGEIWKRTERLDPERRVEQEVPIEEVVEEYRVAMHVIREWIEDHGLAVSFQEYSYLYAAMFELIGESVRRYANHQAARLRTDRAMYLASVMHQLRTPLTALSAQVDLLDIGQQRFDAAAIARLRRNTRRIQALTDGILRLERYEVWEVPVRPEAAYPALLIENIMSDHQMEAARKGLRFEARADRSLCMKVDQDLFADALGNLVHNAVKYTNEGFVIVDTEEHPDHVLFRVRDSGPGIPPEMQRQLFVHVQPGSADGAGIGLQIAQHAAEAQGGVIDVESEVGKGSVFSLCMPRCVEARHGADEHGDGRKQDDH